VGLSVTFKEFCVAHRVTPAEREKLAWYLAALRMQKLMFVLLKGKS